MNSTFYSIPYNSRHAKKWSLLMAWIVAFLPATKSSAQLIYNESFESVFSNTITLSLGWEQYRVTPGNYTDDFWDRVSVGTNPFCLPKSGSTMMRFRSHDIASGQSGSVACKRLDLRNTAAIPANGAPFSFWMWRDSNAGNDSIEIYVNLTPDMAGTPSGPLTETNTFATSINRSCGFAPAPVACNDWNQYFYNVPAMYNGNSSVYIIIVATSGQGNDIHIDDFSVTSYPNSQAYMPGSAEVLVQDTRIVHKNTTNASVIGCRLTMDGAASPQVLSQMVFSTNGSSAPPLDIINAKLWFTGGTDYFSVQNAMLLGTYNQPWFTSDTFLVANWANYPIPGMTSFSGLEHGVNYFWLTYDIPASAVGGNYVDAEWLDFELGSLPAASTIPSPVTLQGERLIYETYCYPEYTMGTSWNDYNSNDFINRVTLVGNGLPGQIINNDLNTITRTCGANAASGCSSGPFPKNCPFQNHPFDYELFDEVPGKTTTLTADSTTAYPISIQCGTYSTGNSVAAWIDYNNDLVFNNWFHEVSIDASGNAGNDTIFLLNIGSHPGWRTGMNVSGTGIAPGATIVTAGVNNLNSPYVVLSAVNSGAVSGAILFTDPDGEKIVQSFLMGPLGTYTTTFNVPITAVAGKLRLRVRENWSNSNISPCQFYTFGETEDYVINMQAACQPFPNYTTWMGYSDQWQDPNNWCPAIAPVAGNPAMNVRIPGGPSGPYTYHQPVIGTGVQALAQKLRVESSDTIFIHGATLSSLTVQDSLKIQDAPSAIVVNAFSVDTVQVTNSTLNIPDNSPLNHHLRSRSFLVFPQSELLANGMQTGDTITNLWIHIQRNSNGNPYRNCTVKYFYCTNASGNFNTGYFATLPTPTGVPVAPVTLYSGDLYPSAFIPTVNGYGTIDLALQTPFAWSGTANALVIEICYDNVGFPSTGTNEEPRSTQTGNLHRYLSIRDLTTFSKSGCSLTAQDTIVVNASWSAGSNTITVSSPAQASAVLPGMMSYPDGRIVVSIAGTTITMDNPAGSGGISTNLVLSNVIVVSSPFRPNMTFVVGSGTPAKYPIFVGGHWENNGTFVQGLSRVTFDGTITDQQIGGLSQTTFYDLDIDNSNHVIRQTDFTVQDSLQLLNGNLKMNLGMMTLLNSDPWAITRINGYIQAETDQLSGNIFPYGRINWKMGSTSGMRTIPFINSTGQSIPLDYDLVSGYHDVIIGTYGTLPNNTNLPLPEVTNVIGFSNGTYNSSGDIAADRFYLLHDSLGLNPTATVTFRYATSERASMNIVGSSPMNAQRWLNATDLWENPFLPGQIYIAGIADQVTLTIADSVFDTSDWWVISMFSAPLGTGVEETNPIVIGVYPNPAQPGELLSLVFDKNVFHPESVRIYSADGREILREKFNDKTASVLLPPGLSPGVYAVQLEGREKRGVMRIVVME